MNNRPPSWFYGMSEMQTYVPTKHLIDYCKVDEAQLEVYTKPIVEKIFFDCIGSVSRRSVRANLSLLFGRDRVNLIRYVNNVLEYYLWWIRTDLSTHSSAKMEVEDIRTSTDNYGNRMKDYVVTLRGYPQYIRQKSDCSTLYVQVFAKLVSEVRKTIFGRIVFKYFTKYYRPENDKFKTKFLITQRVWIDPIHYYDIYVMDIPVNERLISDVYNFYEGEEDYERRVRRIGPRKGLSGI